MQSTIKQASASFRNKYSSNTFNPTDAHRKAKSAFWSHFFSTGEIPPATIEVATAARLSGYNQVLDWWDTLEGFKEWFSNGEEFRQKVEYVSDLALETIHAILKDDSARTGDKLQAAKMALEIAAKFPKAQPKEHFLDQTIAEMGKKELEQFISSKIRHLPQPDSNE